MTERTTLEAWGAGLANAARNSGNPIEAITTLPMPPDRTEVKVVGGWYKPAETDPNGKSLNEPGAKGDAGKLRPAMVLGGFARALLAVSEIGTDGAKKYTEHGWVDVPDGQARYDDAKMRHWLKEKAGQELDSDTQCLHAAHEAWNALARLDLMLREKESLAKFAVAAKALDALIREAKL